MVLEVDFKIFSYWNTDDLLSKYNATRLISFSTVKPKQLLNWICIDNGDFQCGYTIDINHEPWNGYFDSEINENYYHIDHSIGGVGFLRGIYLLTTKNKRKGEAITVSQCDGSKMRLEFITEDILKLEDVAYNLNEVILEWTLFLEKFTQATFHFIECMDKVFDLATSENKKKIGHIMFELKEIKNLYKKLITQSNKS